MLSRATTLADDAETSPKGVEKRLSESLDEARYGPAKDFIFLPIPRHLRYYPDKLFQSGIWINCALAFAAAFFQMADTFQVSYEGVSLIPTLVQAGFTAGMLLITPLGDLIRRRPLILATISTTAALTIGLATSKNLLTFKILSFFFGMANVAPQILVSLAADLAPSESRAFAYSIVLTGMNSGVLLARVLAGVIAECASWRVVYYMAIGAQFLVLLECYFVIPDYPAKNKSVTYWNILWTMVVYAVTEPLVIQVEIIAIATSACFSSYWVTLTFLLGGPPYNYSTVIIGLFGALGLAGMTMGPFAGRLVDGIAPWYGILMSCLLQLVFQAIQTGAGGITIAAVIISCLGLDAFRQVQNVSLVTSMFSVSMEAASRLNAIFVVAWYIGQLLGTSVGTKVFVNNGWRACAALGMALFGFQIVILLLRGPHCKKGTWFGYEGGFGFRRSKELLEGHGRRSDT